MTAERVERLFQWKQHGVKAGSEQGERTSNSPIHVKLRAKRLDHEATATILFHQLAKLWQRLATFCTATELLHRNRVALNLRSLLEQKRTYDVPSWPSRFLIGF
jgi:hypothetical protein